VWHERTREAFVPLIHEAGQAQVDFGEAWISIGGKSCRAHFFALDLPHSDAGLQGVLTMEPGFLRLVTAA